PKLRDRFVPKLENIHEISAASTGLPFSATLVFGTSILHSARRRRRARGCLCSLRFNSGRRPGRAGGQFRFEQTRTNGIGQRDSRPKRQDLWSNLRRKSRDGPI